MNSMNFDSNLEMRRMDIDLDRPHSDEQRKKRWKNFTKEIDEMVDQDGNFVDEGIKETCVIYNSIGFPVVNSCEGHIEKDSRGFESYSLPYVQIMKPYPPRCYEKEMLRGKKRQETSLYQAWRQGNERLRNISKGILDEFYSSSENLNSSRLGIITDEDTGAFSIISDDPELGVNTKRLGAKKKAELAERLSHHQAEMQRFTQFLKEKYNNGLYISR